MKKFASLLYSLIFVVFCLIVFAPGNAQAKYRNLAAMSPAEQRQLLEKFKSRPNDSLYTKNTLDSLKEFRETAEKLMLTDLSWRIRLREAHIEYAFSKNINGYLDLFEESQEKKIPRIPLFCARAIAIHYWTANNLEESMRWYLVLDELLDPIQLDENFEISQFYLPIGQAFYHFGDYEKALKYLNRILVDREWNGVFVAYQTLNTIGLCYQHLGRLDEAREAFDLALEKIANRNERYEAVVWGNIGYNYFLKNDYEAAKPLLEHDLEVALAYNDYPLAAGAATTLSTIYAETKDWTSAFQYLNKALMLIRKSEQTDRLRLVYPVLAKAYSHTHQAELAAIYLDSTVYALKNYNEKYNALQLMKVEHEMYKSEKEASIANLESQHEKRINRRNVIIFVILLLALSIGFISVRKEQAQKIKIRDQEIKLLMATKQVEEAERALHQLAREALALQERLQVTDDGKLIDELKAQIILTEDGWKKFSHLFGKLYPGFELRLKQRYTSLTPAETRCLMMEKLRYSNKEMAALQGISTNAISVTKHRIRKKLQLSQEVSLIDFIKDL